MRQSTRVKTRCLTELGMAVREVGMTDGKTGMETCFRKRIPDMVLPSDRIVVGLFILSIDNFCNSGKKLSLRVCEKRFSTNSQTPILCG